MLPRDRRVVLAEHLAEQAQILLVPAREEVGEAFLAAQAFLRGQAAARFGGGDEAAAAVGGVGGRGREALAAQGGDLAAGRRGVEAEHRGEGVDVGGFGRGAERAEHEVFGAVHLAVRPRPAVEQFEVAVEEGGLPLDPVDEVLAGRLGPVRLALDGHPAGTPRKEYRYDTCYYM
ncbi:hypothetical protein STTU_3771 [Streptomyces sp. Tu6071]|nr:hypothetical protein STTU_3771 [Streptomyces sp. Tu6071]